MNFTMNIVPHIKTSVLSLFLLPFAVSCNIENAYEDVTYESIYQVTDCSLEYWTIKPNYSFSHDFDTESKVFYETIDTSLTYKRAPLSSSKKEREKVCALDWRITDIDVTALEDFDENHSAGSSLKDVLYITYCYKGNYISLPLSDIKYGSIMLSDFYPYAPDELTLSLSLPDGMVYNSAIEVRITDAFGRVFSVKNANREI